MSLLFHPSEAWLPPKPLPSSWGVFSNQSHACSKDYCCCVPGPHPNLQQPSRDTWNSKGQHGWSSDASVLVTACSCDTKGLAKTLFLPGGQGFLGVFILFLTPDLSWECSS